MNSNTCKNGKKSASRGKNDGSRKAKANNNYRDTGKCGGRQR